MARPKLIWQSKLVLLAVLPAAAASVILQAHDFWALAPAVTVWALGISLLFALVVIKLRAGTPGAAFAGAAIAASAMFSTAIYPYLPWRTALIPIAAVFLLSLLATRLGRPKKERLGLAERRKGRNAAQVAANLGLAALAFESAVLSWLMETHWYQPALAGGSALFSIGVAALAEAAADTVSSEVGQALGGTPRMITTFRPAETGTDGGMTPVGTLAGLGAGALVAAAGTWALRGPITMFVASGAGAAFGLFFDSLLGASLERRGWLNNDAVNFLSTLSAAGVAALLLALLTH